MKNYTITVNGNVYDVCVEENKAGATTSVPNKNVAPAAAPVAKPVASGNAGSVRIEAGAAGKVFKLEAKVGDSVKRGDTLLVLEIMKMETPVVATEDGTVASIDVAVGDSVESGALLATLN